MKSCWNTNPSHITCQSLGNDRIMAAPRWIFLSAPPVELKRFDRRFLRASSAWAWWFIDCPGWSGTAGGGGPGCSWRGAGARPAALAEAWFLSSSSEEDSWPCCWPIAIIAIGFIMFIMFAIGCKAIACIIGFIIGFIIMLAGDVEVRAFLAPCRPMIYFHHSRWEQATKADIHQWCVKPKCWGYVGFAFFGPNWKAQWHSDWNAIPWHWQRQITCTWQWWLWQWHAPLTIVEKTKHQSHFLFPWLSFLTFGLAFGHDNKLHLDHWFFSTNASQSNREGRQK